MRLIPAILAIALAMLVASETPGHAQTPPDLNGTWVLTVEGRPVLRLEIGEGPDGRITLTRPGSIQLAQAGGLNGVSGPVRTDTLTMTREGDTLRLVAEPPGAPGPRREYVVRRVDDDRLAFSFVGGPPMPPLVLHRPHDATTVLTDWGGDRIYGGSALTPSEPSNAELKALFDADQAARADGPNTDWSIVMGQDRERRAQTRAMLDAGGVRTGDDFFHAAFIFQHGEASDDYLLAHALAVTAVSRGRADAAWIAAATLDRYLQNIGQPQVYGTQFQIPHDDGPVTQGPYNRALIPDAARIAVGVPDLAGQDEQRAAYEARRDK